MATATGVWGNPGQRIEDLCRLYLRAPASVSMAGDVTTYTFVPALSVAEQATFDRIVKLAKGVIAEITPAEWQAIEDDIAGLVTYQGLPSPTLPQTVLAVKAQSRILRALLRS